MVNSINNPIIINPTSHKLQKERLKVGRTTRLVQKTALGVYLSLHPAIIYHT